MRAAVLLLGPGLAVAGLFAIFLGHRSDYLGHYLAGLGGTLGATFVLLAWLPGQAYASLSGPLIAAASLVCIGLGAAGEATVFRLAKFDEIDFGNQSLGAVVAGLSCLAGLKSKPPVPVVAGGLIVSVGFLVAGFHYAFAK